VHLLAFLFCLPCDGSSHIDLLLVFFFFLWWLLYIYNFTLLAACIVKSCRLSLQKGTTRECVHDLTMKHVQIFVHCCNSNVIDKGPQKLYFHRIILHRHVHNRAITNSWGGHPQLRSKPREVIPILY
jgi:hypothetical protein